MPQVIVVHKDSPFKTFEELLAAMKASPGKITFGGAGIGGSNHSAFYKFNKAAGVTGAYVPFKDSSSTIAALKSGATDAAWSFTTQGVSDGDSIRMLAMAAEKRIPLFPDLSTLTELGYPVIDMAWWGIGVPPGTPDDIRKMVSDTFEKVVTDPEVNADMEKGGYLPLVIPFPASNDYKAKLGADYSAVGKALAKK